LGQKAQFPTVTVHHNKLNEIISQIPADASLATQNDIFPHVCHRFNVSCGYRTSAEYVLVDTSSRWFDWRPEEMEYINQNYGLVANADNIYLFKKAN
ncbi:MAG: hypothetical protein WC325_05445, partial [Candidatus Bathyarchaeia archaeon]